MFPLVNRHALQLASARIQLMLHQRRSPVLKTASLVQQQCVLAATLVSTQQQARHLAQSVLLDEQMRTAIQPLHARSALSASMQQQELRHASTVMLGHMMATLTRRLSALHVVLGTTLLLG
jgi:hypothetical protein